MIYYLIFFITCILPFVIIFYMLYDVYLYRLNNEKEKKQNELRNKIIEEENEKEFNKIIEDINNLLYEYQKQKSIYLNYQYKNHLKHYYDILELDINASKKEIKKAYYRLAKLYHPDKNKGNLYTEQKFKEILDAYNKLK